MPIVGGGKYNSLICNIRKTRRNPEYVQESTILKKQTISLIGH